METRPDPYADPVIYFSVDEARLCLSLVNMSRIQGEEAILRWYPEAIIELDE